ncbi:tRNA (adenosine(37)-N6)-dimethylallyltransferase MiaA [Dyadobacter chenwenxiniae]|uniref:tRNA dimethylallyltransferase n=1 Tax=Dyadobacter chenwenxiniae TaxID=2906456 RepID=A0A9X1PMM3_9BACT|nr:tRNA (adenosine(37)-N6)-dimethylallyltransferase MiaA [Dyadobacter chenwenxiniae]MCF0064192.1 tRNA (adenosine(37)-N6)-dimethylallyltransferase MiaA [Dyadobacter chenwenxiniae]UON82918.1 tRNA (adenosine(37)-N6)-dimethylallyltransferase MiaA [Dyadobacter chenwenxiniae]
MSESPKKYLIIIAGPTAVGKTAMSIQIARALNTEIISADSRQFFRELNIGTAKPTLEELAQVNHHFINSHSISENYSAGDFERDVLKLLEKLFETHDYVVMTGGSGFYVKAVSEGLDDLPAPLPGLRESLTEKLHANGLNILQEELREKDPAFAATPEVNNPQRVVRALEVFYTTGAPISQYHLKNTQKRPFEQILIALDRDRTELYNRIDLRMDMMLANGLVEEAKDLLPYRAHHALQTVGYKEVYGFLDNQYDEAEMIRLLKQNSRRYAKRQLTWFRHQGKFEWFQANEYEKILTYIQARIQDNEQ